MTCPRFGLSDARKLYNQSEFRQEGKKDHVPGPRGFLLPADVVLDRATPPPLQLPSFCEAGRRLLSPLSGP